MAWVADREVWGEAREDGSQIDRERQRRRSPDGGARMAGIEIADEFGELERSGIGEAGGENELH